LAIEGAGVGGKLIGVGDNDDQAKRFDAASSPKDSLDLFVTSASPRPAEADLGPLPGHVLILLYFLRGEAFHFVSPP
jgi:hypothetical protein